MFDGNPDEIAKPGQKGKIKRDSARKNRHKKQDQGRRNRSLRAELYQRRGSCSSAEWHQTIVALSQGTAG